MSDTCEVSVNAPGDGTPILVGICEGHECLVPVPSWLHVEGPVTLRVERHKVVFL